ncbi:MAG: hypothetical protein H6662_08855 [Ardenticatenaceae bacterium]|nr:hypothetical protein [Anaerolineales bacterium]MCB8921678.1 hypothetical protein [Ardenticatenaceae bacterium]MCB9003290.1 hypothetical protein [Ardenticatenaceae bacterium]
MPKKYALSSGLIATMFIVLLVTWLGAASTPVRAAHAATAVKSAHITLHTTNNQGLTFTLHTPTATTTDGTPEVSGLNFRTQETGAPDLPFYATYIALPPDANVAVAVNTSQIIETAVPHLQPVPTHEPIYDDLSSEMMAHDLSQPIYREDTAVYKQNAIYPAVRYTLSDPMYYGDLRLVRLTLYPLRYNPVAGLLEQTPELNVTLTFSGEDISKGNVGDGRYNPGLDSAILNYEQASSWHHLPQNVLDAPATALPVGQETYKITLDQDGIYEISGADMRTAGMDVDNTDPATLEMLYRGEPVAFQLIDNGDTVFDDADKIRFYGWAFDGPRAEKQYVGTQNVYWLWANGSSSHIITATNEAGQGHDIIDSFPESITVDTPEQYMYHTQTSLWALFPNDPDAWYMDRISKSNANPITKTYTITLPHPLLSGPDAQILAEVMTIKNQIDYVGRVSINDDPNYGEATLPRYWNANITATVPITALQHMANAFHYTSLTAAGSGSLSEVIYINRVTVDYMRQLTALTDELIFTAPYTGTHEFQVAGFGSDQALVWDISNRLAPVAIEMNGAISNTAVSTYTYQIGRTHDDNAAFIATTTANLRQPISITSYTPPSLEPFSGGAAWIAISHADFITSAIDLASHRSDPFYGGLSTQVVDIADVIDQYGYGLATPGAIRSYLAHAYGSWDERPAYVVLFGDTTFNPLNKECLAGCQSGFDPLEPTYLLTDLIFKDPYQGLIPSDHTLVMVSGDDILPDMAIGRIAAATAVDAETAVYKIMQYEQNQASPTTWPQHNRITFAADNDDDGGFFCDENQIVSDLFPATFTTEKLCIVENEDITLEESTDEVRLAMQTAVSNGISILNYRGHGSPWGWAGNPNLLTVDTIDFWNNFNKPIVIISADCLDGYFTYPGLPGLAETFLKLDFDMGIGSRGTAAHWSSTGLGTTSEHTALLSHFYNGVFEEGYTAVGDAAMYAKFMYYLGGYQQAEIYSFTLQGDPAMHLYRPDLNLQMNATPLNATPSSFVTFTLTIENQALYPAYPMISGTMPPELAFVDASSTVPISYTSDQTSGLFTLNVLSSLPENEAVTLTVTAIVSDTAPVGSITVTATVDSSSLDLNFNDNTDQIDVTIYWETLYIYLPTILRP